jgi:hypothetical protein
MLGPPFCNRCGSRPRPYFDDDFEVFIDASQSNYFYVEFEMNARSQTRPQTVGDAS